MDPRRAGASTERARTRVFALVLALAAGCGGGPGGGWAAPDAGAEDGGGRAPARAEPACLPLSAEGTRSFPCGTTPSTGRCVAADTMEHCVTGHESVEPRIVRTRCPLGTACDDAGEGASCRTVVECRGEERRCLPGGAIGRCVGGVLLPAPCAGGCRRTLAGDRCAGNVALRRATGSLVHAGAGVEGALLVARDDEVVHDAVHTGPDGRFALDVPERPSAADRLEVWLAESRDGALALFVAEGDVRARLSGAYTIDDARVHRGALPVPDARDATPELGAEHADAVRAFTMARAALRRAERTYGRPAPALAILLSDACGASGACFVGLPAEVEGHTARSFVVLSRPVRASTVAHELGHYWMHSFGVSPREGGRHRTDVAYTPGLAWSEGWATWLGCVLRDVRGCETVTERADRTGPGASCGLEQLITEAEVTAILAAIASEVGEVPLLAALASPRMTVSPFARGYHTHLSSRDERLRPIEIVRTDRSAPHLADFLDALLCAGTVDAAQLAAIVAPETGYPHPVHAPLCD